MNKEVVIAELKNVLEYLAKSRANIERLERLVRAIERDLENDKFLKELEEAGK